MRRTDRPVIGMFDSGMGGISVLGQALVQLPQAHYHYLADVDHVPYGSKDPAQVRSYVAEAADFLMGQGIDLLVIACNTATSVAADALRQRYDLPIVGMEPAVKPAVKAQATEDRNRIVVTATDMTLKLDKLHSLIDRLQVRDRIDPLSLQALVDFAEAGDFDSPEVRRFLQDRFRRIDLDRVHSVVLGCTHFSFYKPLLREILPMQIQILDGNEGTVRLMRSFFKGEDLAQAGPAGPPGEAVSFYESGRPVTGPGMQQYLRFLDTAMAIAKGE